MTGEVDRDAKFPQLGIQLASRRVAAAGSDPLTSEIHGRWENGESQRYWGTTHGIDGWIHANFGFYHVNNL